MNWRHISSRFCLALLGMLLLSSCNSITIPPLFDLSELHIPNFRALQPEGLQPPPPSTPEEREDSVLIPAQDITELIEITEVDWFKPSTFILDYWQITPVTGDTVMIRLQPKETQADASKVLFLYTRPHQAFDTAVSQILATLTSRKIPTESAVILFDPAETGQGEQALQIAESDNFDLIFTVGSSPTAYVHDNYKGGRVPVVTVLSKDPVLLGQMSDFNSGSGSNIAYTSVSVPIELQLSYFRQLVPDLQYMVVIYDENNASVVAAQVEPLNNYAISRGMEVIQVGLDDEEQAEAQLTERLPAGLQEAQAEDPTRKHSLVVVTSSGILTPIFDSINELSAGYPVVSLFNELVREGESSALMSISVSFDSNSILAAVYGARILEGEDPGDLPVGVITPPDLRINFLKVRELGIQIPFNFFENATIIFGPEGDLVRDWQQQ